MKTDIFFVTNRNPLPVGIEPPNEFGTGFNLVGIDELRFGLLKGFKDDGITPVIEVEPETRPGVVPKEKGLFARLQGLMASKVPPTDTIVYIHGFNTGFDGAMQDAQRISDNFNTSDKKRFVVVVFTWPSLGKAFEIGLDGNKAYHSDQTGARASGPALARFFATGYDFLRQIGKPDPVTGKPTEPCNNSIHIIAHSMGNFALDSGVRALARLMSRSTLPRAFANAFLMAADDDSDALESKDKLQFICDMADFVSVYYNRNDFALSISQESKNNMPRLGYAGPSRPALIPNNVVSVDCTKVAPRDFLHKEIAHGYFKTNPIVVADMLRILLGGSVHDSMDHRRFVPATGGFVLE